MLGEERSEGILSVHFVESVLLTLIHILMLTVSYFYWFIREISIIFSGGKKRAATAELKKIKKFPSHVAVVIGEDATGFKSQLVESLAFLTAIPEVVHISVFFKDTAIPLPNQSSKVSIYQNSDVAKAFREAMEANEPLETIHFPFEKRLDLVIVYSKSSSLCNFFPWHLDLTTFALAGPLVNLSPYSIAESLRVYQVNEQRFGK
jgi:uncharacterized MAPEG superfamily protein